MKKVKGHKDVFLFFMVYDIVELIMKNIKKTGVALFILVFSISFQVKSQQTINASILKMTFSPPRDLIGNAGNMIFNKIRIIRSDMMIILENADDVFNSEIFLRKNFLGFKGKYHSFGFFIEDSSFLENIVESKVENATININDQRLSFTSEYFNFISPDTNLSLSNAGIFCLKDLNIDDEINSLIFGCLNAANFSRAVMDESATIEVSLKNNEQMSSNIYIYGILNNLEITESEINLQTGESKLIVDDMILEASNLDFKCPKNIITPPFDVRNIVNDCFAGTVLNSGEMDLIFKNSKDSISKFSGNIIDLDLNVLGNQILLKIKNLNLNFPINKTKASISDFKAVCFDKELDRISIEDITKVCGLNLVIKTNEDENVIPFEIHSIANETDINVDSELKLVHLKKDSLLLDLKTSQIEYGTMKILNQQALFSCKKLEEINEETFSDFFNICVNDFSINNIISIMEDTKTFTRVFIDINKIKTTPDRIFFNVKSFQKINKKDIENEKIKKGSISIFNMNFNCANNNRLEELNKDSFIKNCLSLGKITLDSMTSSQKYNNEIYNQYNGAIRNEINHLNFDPFKKLKKIKPSMKNLSIVLINNSFSFKGKVYSLRVFRKVELNGKIIFNKRTQELEIKLTNVRLPVPYLGRKIWFATWVIKQFVSSELISVRNKKIYIKIKGKK